MSYYRTLIYYGKTVVLWEKNCGTMDKTMVLWTKLWYYTENYRTSGETWYIPQNCEPLIYNRKNNSNIPKQLKLQLKNFNLQWKNYSTMEKTIDL